MKSLEELSKSELLNLIYNNLLTNFGPGEKVAVCSVCGERADGSRVMFYICDQCNHDLQEAS